MTWFSLPITQPENQAAFGNSRTAAAWLAQQPQANAAAMQAELTRQLQALNTWRMPPLERFKTLEVLRKTLFTIDGDAQRRFENRPVPLWSSEQAALDTSRRLWRTCAVAYLHCLRACLDGDPELVEIRAKIAHRALACLRMEQQTCYLGLLDVEPDFWRTLHAILASAEQLDVLRAPIADPLLAETRDSTICGQYAMTLLLHLARPFELSRNQFAAATRWFARWREQADIISAAEHNPKLRCITLDLSLDRPLLEAGRQAGTPRWLAVDNVLRKMRKRLEALEAGETPESLKLGSGISSEASIALLQTLTENLKSPLKQVAAVPPGSPQASVTAGLESIHHLLGGKSLKQLEEPTSINRREQEQIAIFGHVARASEENAVRPEAWLLAPTPDSGTTEGTAELGLCRPAGTGDARLSNKCLLAVQLPGQPRFALASLFSLCMHSDGSLHAIIRLLPGQPVARVAEISERPMGKVSRQPAFLLPAVDSAGVPRSIVLPSGVPARALSIRLDHERALSIKLLSCLERGNDYERWAYETS